MFRIRLNALLLGSICFTLSSCGGGEEIDSQRFVPNSIPDKSKSDDMSDDIPGDEPQHIYEIVGDRDRLFDPRDYDEFLPMNAVEERPYEFNEDRTIQMKRIKRWIGHSECDQCSVGTTKTQKFKISHPRIGYIYRVYVVPSFLTGTGRYRSFIQKGNATVRSGAQKTFVQSGWFDAADDWVIEIEAQDENEIVVELTNDMTTGSHYLYLDYYEFFPQPPSEASAMGFGQSTWGGGVDAPVCWVTSLSDSGSGSLRDCVSRVGPKTVRFKVDGTIALQSFIDIPAHTTIDGVGRSIHITGVRESHLLRVSGARGAYNVIVRNLSFRRGVPGDEQDACNLCKIDIVVNQGSRQILIENNSFQYCINKCIAIQGGIQEVTVSYNKFLDSYYAILVGLSDSMDRPQARFDDRIQVTIHHNLFSGIRRRQPRANRSLFVHLFNNLHDGWGNDSSADFAVGSTTGAQVLIENDIFIAPSLIKAAVAYTWPDSEISDGFIRVRGSYLLGGATIAQSDSGFSFRPTDYYNYSLEVANDSLLAKIRSKVGPNAI